jgi:hypothetical protein
VVVKSFLQFHSTSLAIIKLKTLSSSADSTDRVSEFHLPRNLVSASFNLISDKRLIVFLDINFCRQTPSRPGNIWLVEVMTRDGKVVSDVGTAELKVTA